MIFNNYLFKSFLIMKSISFIVPFYNEEKNLIKSYKTVIKIIQFYSIKNYEIILVNDFSIDGSEKIATGLKKKNKNIFYYKHNKNFGLGHALKTGILASTKEYIIWVPGDNEHNFNGLKPLFDQLKLNNFDIIIPYVINKEVRSLIRQIISKLYTLFLNILFLKNMPYFDGCCLYKRKIIFPSIKEIDNPTMTFVSELLLRSLNKTQNIKIVGYKLNVNKLNKKSSALKLNNIIEGILKILKLRLQI